MNRLVLTLLILAICSLVSCKSHKATVVRPGVIKVEKTAKAPSVPKGAHSKPQYSNDKKISEALVKKARSWIGTPYRYGGDTKKGTDCSGFVRSVFNDVAHLSLPRNSAAQCEYCFDVPKKKLQPGDLVFFSSSTRGGKVTHVGLYVGNGKMIHASTSRGVIESGLDEKYYSSHYHSSGRVYGITYAATGGKKPKSVDKQEILLASEGVPKVDTPKPKVAEKPKEKAESPKKTKKPAKTKAKPGTISGASAIAVAPKKDVQEVTLDDFVAMNKTQVFQDTVVIEERIIEETVAALDSASAVMDSVKTMCSPDSVVTVESQPEPQKVVEAASVKPAKVKVNGKEVEVIPVKPQPEKKDSVPADSVHRAEAIREDVVKAMRFGK